jgi:hypothetical protein
VQSYDGKDSDLEAWLAQTRDILSYTPRVDLENPSAVRYAALFLTGRARDAWEFNKRETQDGCCNCTSFNEFARLMRRMLGPANANIVGRSEIRRLAQTGSVQSYTDRFRRLAASLETPMQAYDLLEFYIDGLKPEVQKYVRQQSPGSPNDAYEKALYYDKTFYRLGNSARSSQRNHHHNPAPSGSAVPMELGTVHAGTSRNSYKSRSPSRSNSRSPTRSFTPRRQQTPQRSSSPAVRLTALTAEERQVCIKEGRCFRCRALGHTSSQCPKNTQNPPRGRSPSRKN